jgi:hypothetical protein
MRTGKIGNHLVRMPMAISMIGLFGELRIFLAWISERLRSMINPILRIS